MSLPCLLNKLDLELRFVWLQIVFWLHRFCFPDHSFTLLVLHATAHVESLLSAKYVSEESQSGHVSMASLSEWIMLEHWQHNERIHAHLCYFSFLSLQEECFLNLEAPISRVCGYDTPFPPHLWTLLHSRQVEVLWSNQEDDQLLNPCQVQRSNSFLLKLISEGSFFIHFILY